MSGPGRREDEGEDGGLGDPVGEDRPLADSPAIGTLQAAAREAIDATRALLDVAEALVNDPETAERIGAVVRAATTAAARAVRAAEGAGGREDDDDGGPDGVQHIPVE